MAPPYVDPGPRRELTEAIHRPCSEVIHGLRRRGRVEPPEQMVAAERAENLHVDHVRRGLVDIRVHAGANRFGVGAVDQDLEETGSVNHQHLATAP